MGIDLSKEIWVGVLFIAVVTGLAFVSNPEGFYVFPSAILPWTGLGLSALILGLFSLLERRRTRKQEAETSGIPA